MDRTILQFLEGRVESLDMANLQERSLLVG